MKFWIVIFLYTLLFSIILVAKQNKIIPQNYQNLVDLFLEWRSFENPPLLDGAPDYRPSRFEESKQEFEFLKNKLFQIDTSNWSIKYQIDWHILRAEMNGYDFNFRVLKPWVRDPAFYQTIWMYQSDVPAHEGPTNHGILEFWTYHLPLNAPQERKLQKELLVIPSLLNQARNNLTGNAKDLWIAGIENFKDQEKDLKTIIEKWT